MTELVIKEEDHYLEFSQIEVGNMFKTEQGYCYIRIEENTLGQNAVKLTNGRLYNIISDAKCKEAESAMLKF